MATTAANTVTATRPTRNLTLPNEVLTMIASECDPADLKNMRLASKLTHQVSTQPFARKKFSRRRFIFTYQSMKALIDITAHPVFGRYLTCLTFGTYRLLEDLGYNATDHDELVVEFDMARAMQAAFLKGNHHVKMLTLALKNLKNCHNTEVILGIYDDFLGDDLRRQGYAFRASYKDFIAHEPDVSGTLNAVLGAWRSSGYPLKALKLCLSGEPESIRELGHENDHAFISLISQPKSRSSSSLDFYINVWYSSFYAKMKLTSDFTRLELSRHDWDEHMSGPCELLTFDDYTYGKIWEAINQKSLEVISIERSNAVFEDFVAFLRMHRSSLRTLELRQIRMLADNRPAALALRFLRFSRDNLNLEHLTMDTFIIGDDFKDKVVILDDVEMVCDGPKSVADGLDQLIQKVTAMYQEA
ncbi:hypothetical protein KCU65_g3663, partial [Aureobasidium melanogenum]